MHGSSAQIRTSPVHGRGLFASQRIAAGGLIGTYPLLILSADDTAVIKGTRLYHYVFYVDEDASGAIRAAVAFGEISMCNHSPSANAEFEIDAAGMQVVLSAAREIMPDEEILIDYQEFADVAI